MDVYWALHAQESRLGTQTQTNDFFAQTISVNDGLVSETTQTITTVTTLSLISRHHGDGETAHDQTPDHCQMKSFNMALEEAPNGHFPGLPSGSDEVNRMIEENPEIFTDAHCKVCSAVLNSDSQKLSHYQSKKHASKVRRYMSLQKEEQPVVKKFKSALFDTDSEACSNGESEQDRMKACLVCNMTFSSPVVAMSHYNGKTHTKNLKLKTFGLPPPEIAPLAPKPPKKKVEDGSSAADLSDPERYCPSCHASFNNPLMAQQHYDGKKHKRQMTKKKLMETYTPSTTPGEGGSEGEKPSEKKKEKKEKAPSTVKGLGYPCSLCNLTLNSVEQFQAHISGAKHKARRNQRGGAEDEYLVENEGTAMTEYTAEVFNEDTFE